jgi:sporulation protein YlmC with PRC-barrel domain
MLRSMKDLVGYTIRATDGDIGQVSDFYFEDDKWVVRYLIVEAGHWLSSRKVLISPIAIGTPDRTRGVLPVSLTKEQVENSPDIDTDEPVSRQQEMRYHGYYDYPYYWGGTGIWGLGAYPGMMLSGSGYGAAEPGHLAERAEHVRMTQEAALHQNDDPHLRSGNAVMKYHIEASDGSIGHVEGLLLDEDTWAIRYLIVDTSNWWLGHEVLIAPEWIRNVSWFDHRVSVNLTRQAVKDAPPYDSATALDRSGEINLYNHYKRDGYWAGKVRLENPEIHTSPTLSEGAIRNTGDAYTEDKRAAL